MGILDFQIPALWLLSDVGESLSSLVKSERLTFALATNGLCFHLQSMAAYALMGYISPITHSVANTAKRAILIWLSVLVFANEVQTQLCDVSPSNYSGVSLSGHY